MNKGSRAMVTLLLLFTFCIPVLAQQCLHGANETLDQRYRRQSAAYAVRLIADAELDYFVKFDKPGTLPELAASGILENFRSNPVYRSISLIPGTDLLPGFELQLSIDKNRFLLLLRDNTDPC